MVFVPVSYIYTRVNNACYLCSFSFSVYMACVSTLNRWQHKTIQITWDVTTVSAMTFWPCPSLDVMFRKTSGHFEHSEQLRQLQRKRAKLLIFVKLNYIVKPFCCSVHTYKWYNRNLHVNGLHREFQLFCTLSILKITDMWCHKCAPWCQQTIS